MIVATKKMNFDQLTAVIAVGGVLNAAFVGLKIAGDPPSEDSFLSAAPADGGIEEPTDVAGYARQALVPGSLMDVGGGAFRVVGTRLEFFGDDDHPVTVLGYFVASAVTDGDLIYQEEFDTPIPLTATLQAIVFDPPVVIGSGADYGTAIVL